MIAPKNTQNSYNSDGKQNTAYAGARIVIIVALSISSHEYTIKLTLLFSNVVGSLYF